MSNTRFLAVPASVLKRDGRRMPFDVRKIELALQRAGIASGEYGSEELDLLMAGVLVFRPQGLFPARA